MSKKLLDVKNLFVNVDEKEILHGVDLSVGKGETHVLMGPNGTGKSPVYRNRRRNLVQRRKHHRNAGL